MATVRGAHGARGAPTLVRICDLAGRTRGTGFLADDLGTLVTSHEAVDGLRRVVVHAPTERPGRSGDAAAPSCLAEADAITPLPEWDLALVRTAGLGVAPEVIGVERARVAGLPVRVWTGEWRDARLTGLASATYTSTDRFHPLEDVLELALPEAAAVEVRLSRRVSGAPVVDAETGAVLAVLGTALHAPRRTAAFAVPLRAAGLLEPEGPVGTLLARNGATVPGFGPDLNLAGALQLTATSVGPAVERAGQPVARPETAEALREFGESGASVVALVGEPGTGRTTELAALAARRARGVAPAPTVWLRGADLRDGDGSVREAVARALEEAGRIVAASGGATGDAQGCVSGDACARGHGGGRDGGRGGGHVGDPGEANPGIVSGGASGDTCARGCGGGHVGDPRQANPDVVARLARGAGRPLLVVLDGPEEMPPRLAHGLRRWTAGTTDWLRASGARMAVACRPEHWELAGPLFPAEVLYGAGSGGGGGGSGEAAALRPCVRLGDLLPGQAARARAHYGVPDGTLGARDAAHPLTLRMLAGVRAALGEEGSQEGATCGAAPVPPARSEVFDAHLALVALRVAVRLAAAERPVPRGGAVRRLAARVAGRIHEAARRCLGPGQGALERSAFEEVFPWGGGWASAVLAEGVLVPAGDGYRFADEEFADWAQGRHLELDVALEALVHRRDARAASVPVPRHRIGPVVQALLLCGEEEGPEALSRRLLPLVDFSAPDSEAASDSEAAWWAAHLLGETLLRVPEARPYAEVLRALATRVVATVDSADDGGGSGDGVGPGGFGPPFWRRLPLPTADRLELLRLLLPADAPYGQDGERYLDAVGALLVAEPREVRRLLCGWFDDGRPLRRRADVGGDGVAEVTPTVASAAQALLHTHRTGDVDDLIETLADSAHPRADELLRELAHDEPTAFCRALDRWAHDACARRRGTAARHAPRAARHARTPADHALLRRAALALLPDRDGGVDARAAALAVLVRDPYSRSRYLDVALTHFAASGAPELASALGSALGTHPEPVLAAFRARLRVPEADAAEVSRALAQARIPAVARRAVALVREHAELRPGTAGEAVEAFVRRRLTHGPSARAVLRPLVTGLLATGRPALRAALARALGGGEGPLRDELLEELCAGEREASVLGDALCAVVRGAAARRAVGADGCGDGAGDPMAEPYGEAVLVRRLGLLMGRTAEGAARFDRDLVGLAREVPGFAARLLAWHEAAPGEWSAVVGPGARRACESLAEHGRGTTGTPTGTG
ncbi:trypsin-like peptidase domain-containing protein [Streptomyces sp. NPDC054796]